MSSKKTTSNTTRPHIIKRAGGALFLLTCVIIAALLLLNRQWIVDRISVQQYSPTPQIESLVFNGTMTQKGTFYFYAAHPSIDDAKTFNDACQRKEEHAAILGCYDGKSIYIYNVEDARLAGIKTVTAAHEMLHVAYSRLGAAEKQRVNDLLQAEYNKQKSRLNWGERLSYYERAEPGQQYNELHSMFATEVAAISEELEEYYKIYFSDRQKLVSFYNAYSNVFNSLRQRAETIVQNLKQKNEGIETQTNAYNKELSAFNSEVSIFNRRAQIGDFSSEAMFTQERNQLEQRAKTLQYKRNALTQRINEYNALVKELNTISTETQELRSSIDSSPEPIPGL